MKDILERVINLIKKTGDRIVIVDQKDQSAYVVMDVGSYERIIERQLPEDLTGNETADKMDKINRDIAFWREEIDKNDGETEPPADLPIENGIEEKETETQFYFEPVE